MNKKFKVNKYVIFNKKRDFFIFNILNGYLYTLKKSNYDVLYKFYRLNKEFTLEEITSQLQLSSREINELMEKYIILPSKTDEKEIAKFIFDSFRRSAFQISFTICPTLECNLSCKYCFEKSRGKFRMNEATAEKVVEFILKQTKEKIENEIISLIWYGGEPLLNFSIIKYIIQQLQNKLRSKKIISNLVTNGTLLTSEVLKQLKNLSFKKIQICFDGDEKYHDCSRPLRNGGASFSLIYENFISGIKNFTDISWTIRINVYEDNIQGIYDLLLKFKKDRLAYYRNYNIAFHQVFISPFNQCFTQCGNLKDISKNIYKLTLFAIKNGLKSFPLPYYNICNFMTLNSFIIDPKGDLYKCEETVGVKKYCIGNVSKGVNFVDFIKFFYHTPYDKPSLYKNCKRCKILPYCNGYCPISYFLGSKIKRCSEFKYILPQMVKLFIYSQKSKNEQN